MSGPADRIDVVHLIGTLDRCISEMIVMADDIASYDEPDRQTLKHHAEDAVLAGKAVLKKLGVVEPHTHDVCVCKHWRCTHDDDACSDCECEAFELSKTYAQSVAEVREWDRVRAAGNSVACSVDGCFESAGATSGVCMEHFEKDATT